MNFLDIQSYWEIPSIAYFCSLYSNSFKLPEFDIEDLEEALLADGTDALHGLLSELIVKLLLGCYPSKKHEITTSSYQMFLRRIFRMECKNFKIENTFDSDVDFHSLPLHTKILNLQLLCDFRLASADVPDIIAKLEPSSLRVDPLGCDNRKSTYWYFYGTRLYREDKLTAAQAVRRQSENPHIGGRGTVWQVVCFTEDDWHRLTKKFSSSSSKVERELYETLNENFVPSIKGIFRSRELLRRRKLITLRTSSRLNLRNAKKDELEKTASESSGSQRRGYASENHSENLSDFNEPDHSNASKRSLRIRRQSLFYQDNRSNHRSRSSSIQSIISTYASSPPTAVSSDLLFQPQTKQNYIVHSRSGDDDATTSSSSDTECILPLSRTSQASRTKATTTPIRRRRRRDRVDLLNAIKTEQTAVQRPSEKNVNIPDIDNNVKAKPELEIEEDCYRRSHQSHNNRCREDKENINTITLSTDDDSADDGSDTDNDVYQKISQIMPPANSAAGKLPGRQTNNSLSSLTGNIFIPPLSGATAAAAGSGSGSTAATAGLSNSTTAVDDGGLVEAATGAAASSTKSKNKLEKTAAGQQQRKKKSKSSEVFSPTLIPTLSFTETEEVLQIGMHKVLVHVKNHKDAWPFMDPVEEDIAPRYYTIIRRPMDLLKMEEKLDNGEYATFTDFRNDFKLIVNNCRLYNGQNNEYTEMVNSLQMAFEKSTKKYFEQNSSDEEINLEYPDLKTNVFREKNFNTKNVTPKQSLFKEFMLKAESEALSGGKKCKSDTLKRVAAIVEAKGTRDESRDREKATSPRGTKRKRKDKDKRRKKKLKIHNKKHATSDDEDDELDDDDDNDDRVSDEELKPRNSLKSTKKHDKKKRKVSPSPSPEPPPAPLSPSPPPRSMPTTKKTKSKESKDSKKELPKPTNNKRKQKLNKKMEYPSDEDDDMMLMDNDEDGDVDEEEEENIENVKRSKATTTKKSAKSAGKSKNEKSSPAKALKIASKKEVKSKKRDVSAESKKIKVEAPVTPTTPKKRGRKPDKTGVQKSKTDKKSKRSKERLSSAEESAVENNDKDDIEDTKSISSAEVVIDYPISKSKSTKQKKMLKSQQEPTTSPPPPEPPKLSAKQKKKLEKENQNFKSKRKVEKKIVGKPGRKPAGKKAKATISIDETSDHDEVTSPAQSPRSRSSSRSITPVFTVDLHKKYSQSASKASPVPVAGKMKKPLPVDQLSISSRSFSRSPSPLASHYSSTHSLNSLEDEDDVPAATSPAKTKKNKVITPTIAEAVTIVSAIDTISRSVTPEIKDKYDLIKERRWKQIVKDAEKSKGENSTASTTASSKVPPQEKNHKLKETIEKLKAKNKSGKKQTVLFDEIFGAKPTKEIRDERTIYERLRECGEKSAPAAPVTNKPDGIVKDKADEYNFVDDLPVEASAKNVAAQPTPASSTTSAKPPKDATAKPKAPRKSKATTAAAAAAAAASALKNPQKSTNMEALELETEQTLKDINRWLEHTPRFTDFSSASNSPSRYNLLDDFDSVTAKLEAEFRRPAPAAVPIPKPSPTTQLSSIQQPVNVPTLSSSTISSVPVRNADFNLLKDPNFLSITPGAVPVVQPVVLPSPSTMAVPASSSTIPTPASSSATPVLNKQTIQLVGLQPAPGHHKREPKEQRRKTLKEKLTGVQPKRKDLHRTIERLQPGKTKGNLIAHGAGKTDDLFPPSSGASGTTTAGSANTTAKPKEVKNSLVQPESETGPKLSLGSVLNTAGFGLGQQHNFSDEIEKGAVNISDEISKDRDSDDMELEEIITSTEMQEEIEKALLEKDRKRVDVDGEDKTVVSEKPEETTVVPSTAVLSAETKLAGSKTQSATPNLSAWFKAFGAPKKSKKAEEEEAAAAAATATAAAAATKLDESKDISVPSENKTSDSSVIFPSSPTEHPPGFMLPAPRTRKASTGSTVSERSSYSQDPDSPRIGIDERLGGSYPAPYPSPLGASPVMASPKDELPKPASPYPINGAIKVGFYQDTTTKSSPEKSCSPREQPSPYSNYAQHLYSSASATVAAAYGGACSYQHPVIEPQPQPTPTATLGFNNSNKTPSYYDQYKQPRSQDSDYNSSMSPNPNSPYQNQQQSPYQQPQNSPYQQPQSSPFHPQQQQVSPASRSSMVASPAAETAHSPSFQAPNSPFQPQQQLSPYQQPNSPVPHFHQSQPSPGFQQQQQPLSPAFVQQSSPAAAPQQAPQPLASAVQPAVPYQANPSSPYSHDANSTYNQTNVPISPYNPVPNSPNIQATGQKQMPTSNTPEWGNLATQPEQPTKQQQPQQHSPAENQKHQMGATQDWVNLSNSQLNQQHLNQHQQQQLHDQQNTEEPTKQLPNPNETMHSMYNPIPAHLPKPQQHQLHHQQTTQQQPQHHQSQHQQQYPQQNHLQPPNAHGYMQTYPNPYMDRRPDELQQQSKSSGFSAMSDAGLINDRAASSAAAAAMASAARTAQQQHQPQHIQQQQQQLHHAMQHHALQQQQQQLQLRGDHSLGFPDMTSVKGKIPEKPLDTSQHPDSRPLETPKPPSGDMNRQQQQQQQQMFDHLLGSIGKSIGGFSGSKRDISSSKAFEMFNRAAMGFSSKNYPPGTPPTTSSPGLSNKATEDLSKMSHYANAPTVPLAPLIPPASAHSSSKQPDMVNMGYGSSSGTPPASSQLQPLGKSDKKMNSPYGTSSPASKSSFASSAAALAQQHHHQQMMTAASATYAANLASAMQTNKISGSELNVPNPRLVDPMQQNQQKATCELNVPNLQRYDVGRHPNMDLSSYKSYGAPSPSMMDPTAALRNLNPLSMMDESLLSMQQSPSAAGYYQKDIPPAHMFSKAVPQSSSEHLHQMLNNTMTMAYNANREQQQHQQMQPQQHQQQHQPPVSNFQRGTAPQHPSNLQNISQPQPTPTVETKAPKRTRKKKTATPAPAETSQMLQQQNQQQHQHQQQQQQHTQQHQLQQHQGFQSYAGLKTNPSTMKGSPNSDASAISLKTATAAAAAAASMVPGSAFNFGPTPTGLGGIYGDQSGYLDDFRSTPNPYYLPAPTHRSTPDPNVDKTGNPAAASSATPTYHQFLPHPTSRGAPYPFMNASLDQNQIYAQQALLQRHMMLNQSLMGHAAPGGYPQTGYHPALSMHKSYEMNGIQRPPWFQ